MVKERPIIFSGSMVRALLAGTKTQTRRIVKPQPEVAATQVHRFAKPQAFSFLNERRVPVLWDRSKVEGEPGRIVGHCPYGQPCDRLWVKETWCELLDEDPPHDVRTYYAATHDGELRLGDGDGFTVFNKDGSERSPWKSPIFMPRRLSRITLEITGVRVERVQEISEADARAEGIDPLFTEAEMAQRPELAECRGKWTNYLWHGRYGQYGTGNAKSAAWQYQFSSYADARGSYSSLWESINGAGSWDANQWAWVVEFKRVNA